jgi:hypothetical protein
LRAQGLAAPHSAAIGFQMHAFAATACVWLGRFDDAIGHWELAVEATPDEKLKAAIRGAIADAKLSEALRTQTPMPHDVLKQVRAWSEATPPAETDEVRSALQHRAAMLRLVEGTSAEAMSLCESAVRWLDTRPDAHSHPEWQVAAATLVIAYARSGRTGEAEELMAQLASDGSLYEAAAAELSTAIGGSAEGA